MQNKLKIFIILILIIFGIIGIFVIFNPEIIFKPKNFNRDPIKNDNISENVSFEIGEGNSLIKSDSKLLVASLLNTPVTLYGRIHDTGAINMFYEQTFDGNNAYSQRYYLENRIYKNPSQSEWVKINGKYSHIDIKGNDAHKIDVASFEKLTDMDGKISEAKRISREWLDENRTSFDLNNYKQTERFKNTFKDLQGIDLNSKKFEPLEELVFVDRNTMVAGIVSGRVVLQENTQRGDYLYYLSIIDLNSIKFFKSIKLLKVIIKNDGYFQE